MMDQKIRDWNHRRIDLFRKWKLSLSNTCFAPFSTIIPANEHGAILVLRIDDKIGDSITATGFLRELKKNFPNKSLIVVAGKSTAPLYNELDFIDEVYIGKKGIFSTLALLLKLKKRSLSYAINTSHILNPRVIFLMSFLKAEKKISFSNTNIKLFTEHVDVDFKTEHVTERYRKTLHMLGVETPNLDYEIKLNEKDVFEANEYIKELRAHTKYIVGLNSFAGGRLRNFSKKTTLALAGKLLENKDITVLSLANAGDHAILDLWIGEIIHERWYQNEDLHTLGLNMALANGCDLIITPDTAWVHIASALKKKLIAVFRADDNPSEVNSKIWAPYKTEFKVIFAKTEENLPADINNIDVNEVAQEAFNMLAH